MKKNRSVILGEAAVLVLEHLDQAKSQTIVEILVQWSSEYRIEANSIGNILRRTEGVRVASIERKTIIWGLDQSRTSNLEGWRRSRLDELLTDLFMIEGSD